MINVLPSVSLIPEVRPGCEEIHNDVHVRAAVDLASAIARASLHVDTPTKTALLVRTDP